MSFVSMDIKIEQVGIAHEDDRRSLIAVFNGDFVAQQVKVIQSKKKSNLGGHNHNYPELYYVLTGRLTYNLEDIVTEERQGGVLEQGMRLTIGSGIRYNLTFEKDTITIGATTEP